ncbi:MAG: hypothetical protein H6839_12630 [Planctomycetes bacterium]|nr:hypothetical protein [Planctomycetota bacterium]
MDSWGWIILVLLVGGLVAVAMIMIAFWFSDTEKLEVGTLFTPLFPDPNAGPPPDSKPPEAKPITPEQKAEARERRDKRETRLLSLIHDTQSNANRGE